MAQDIRVLLAEEDARVREIIRRSCADMPWIIEETADGIQALKFLRRSVYHLLVLEAELPEIDGHIVCRHLRKTSSSPVLFIGMSGNEENRLAAFSCGGNDYVQKPFYPRELVARLQNLLLLTGQSNGASHSFQMGELLLDLDSHGVYVQGMRLILTPKEYELLVFFCRHPKQAFSRNMLLDKVWGQDFFGTDRTVDSHVKSLRSKLRPVDGYIQTVWGVGYRFDCEAAHC